MADIKNVRGVGPVTNADIYAAMIQSPWYRMKPQSDQEAMWDKNPEIQTPAGLISQRDANLITMYGIPSEYTKDFVQEPFLMETPDFATQRQKEATYLAKAGPVKDPVEYADIKKRADKTAKKEMTFEELKKKSKESK